MYMHGLRAVDTAYDTQDVKPLPVVVDNAPSFFSGKTGRDIIIAALIVAALIYLTTRKGA